MQGDLRAILTQVSQLKQQQPEYTAFVDRIIKLADNCQIEELKFFKNPGTENKTILRCSHNFNCLHKLLALMVI